MRYKFVKKKKKGNIEIVNIRQKAIQSKYVKVGLLGFIISLKSLYNLCSQLFTENICEYVLSYKISQDHIEMLFSLIRDMNGYCNNPTSVQFTSA